MPDAALANKVGPGIPTGARTSVAFLVVPDTGRPESRRSRSRWGSRRSALVGCGGLLPGRRGVRASVLEIRLRPWRPQGDGTAGAVGSDQHQRRRRHGWQGGNGSENWLVSEGR